VTAAQIQPGSLVQVGPAYRGNGCYLPDGNEGIYTVLRKLPPSDWYLARGDVRFDLSGADWDLIGNESRMRLVEIAS
jgi:hypothetical protein